jgi:hypothetical protein
LLAHGQWFSPGTPASSTSKTGYHDITEILLKVALNTIKQTNKQTNNFHPVMDFDSINYRCNTKIVQTEFLVFT